MFECVINISEGRDLALLDQLSIASGDSLRDRHYDWFHNRTVFTLINEAATLRDDLRRLIALAYQSVDLRTHVGAHPRFGVVDVVPFVALAPDRSSEACALRDETAHWLSATFDVPVFLYGPLDHEVTRTLPDVRRRAFRDLGPDYGPRTVPPARGAVAVGCRPILVAWNLWLEHVTLIEARRVARALRQPALRTLAFQLGDAVQLSCNLIDQNVLTLSTIYDNVLGQLGPNGRINRAELVGLLPASLLNQEDPQRWEQLGLSSDATIEARLRA
jgi:hypothetical protein